MKTRLSYILLIFFVTFYSITYAIPYTIQSVPNTKLVNNSYVSNPDNLLSRPTVDEINTLLKNIETQVGAQVAVVILDEIDEHETPKSFATSLFNHWGIGNSASDDGLLILLVKSERRIEFETGYGLEGVLPDIRCFRIQQDAMLPHFKNGDYDQGILSGVRLVSNYLINSDLTIPEPTKPSTIELVLGPYWQEIILIYSLLNIAFVIVFFVKKSKIKDIESLYEKYLYFESYPSLLLAVVFPVFFIFIHIWRKRKLKKWRNEPRISKSGEELSKLNEEEEDQFLKKGQQVEEYIESVDYDVWINHDMTEQLTLRYENHMSKYTSCPYCSFKTFSLSHDKTLVSPTYSSSGLGERLYMCESCENGQRQRYNIPRLVRNSGGGSGGGSSSSGGSWGGGGSGGGGAGSSW